jgi:hypothetical protein
MMGGAYDPLMINGIEEEAKKQFEKMKGAWGRSNVVSSLKISTGYTQT